MEFMILDVARLIFTQVSSKDRSVFCSISKYYESTMLKISMELSLFPDLYQNFNAEITDKIMKKIILSHDYHLFARLKNIHNYQFKWICRSGDMDFVNLFINNKNNKPDWITGLYGACRGGHLNLVKLIIQRSMISNFNNAIYYAARGGYLNIIKFLVPRSKNINYNDALHGACRGGYYDIFMWAIQIGAYALYNICCDACKGNNKNIIRYLIDSGEFICSECIIHINSLNI